MPRRDGSSLKLQVFSPRAERVKRVPFRMREGSSPGLRAVPIALWKSLPDEYLTKVAELLNLIEEAGVWPTNSSRPMWR